jgi:hypothetical protein
MIEDMQPAQCGHMVEMQDTNRQEITGRRQGIAVADEVWKTIASEIKRNLN